MTTKRTGYRYLPSAPSPSRALFALAVAAPSASGHNCISNGQQSTWDTIITPDEKGIPVIRYKVALDFEMLEKSLASRLMDDDLRAVLVCIDAANKLSRLKLSGCTNINGSGLELLRGSNVLEQFDLSLLGQHERPVSDPEPKIREDALLPILWSIINKEVLGSSLVATQMQLPEKLSPKRSPAFKQFQVGYNQYLRSRPFWCSGGVHDGDCRGCNNHEDNWTDPWAPEREWIDPWRSQRFTCHSCLGNICEDTEHDFRLKRFSTCEKYYCQNCLEIEKCEECGDGGCSGCN